MPKITFKQFLGKYGVRMLFISSQNIEPGIAIQQENQGFFKYDDLYKAFGEPKKDWTSQLQEANLITGTINRSLSLHGKASMDEFGVSIDGGLSKVSKVTFRISDIKAQTLIHKTRADIEEAMAKLKKTDKVKYKRYVSKFAIDQTYYASRFEAVFEVQSGFNLKAELLNRVRVAPGTDIDWTSNKSFVIASNASVPFGFAGLKF